MKAVIILDKNPKICLDCPACNVDIMEGCKCMALNRNVKAYSRPADCMAQELPWYRSIKPNATPSETMYSSGWNDCLDAILGNNTEV